MALTLVTDIEDYIEIHTTDRMTYKRCRQKWDFQSNIRYNQEPVRPQEALWLGHGFHIGVGAYYDPATPRKLNEAEDSYVAYVEEWVANNEVTDETYDWAMGMKDLGVAMLGNYVGYAKKEDKFDVLWVEREFHIPLLDAEGNQLRGIDGRPVVYSFRVDGLVIDKHGRVWILEHKTTSQFFSNTEWLLMDDQVGSYIWGLHQVEEFFGMKIEGVIYNWAKKKIPVQLKSLVKGGYSVDKSQDTTPRIVRDTLTAAYGDYANWDQKYKDFFQYVKNKENNFVRRETVRRNAREIAYVGQAILFEVWEMVNDPAIYRTPSSMNCQFCPFVGPCLARWEGGDFEHMLLESGLYQERQNAYSTREVA